MLHFFSYLRNRLCERSTWAAIAIGIPAASALPKPWNLLAAVVAAIGALTPEPTKD